VGRGPKTIVDHWSICTYYTHVTHLPFWLVRLPLVSRSFLPRYFDCNNNSTVGVLAGHSSPVGPFAYTCVIRDRPGELVRLPSALPVRTRERRSLRGGLSRGPRPLHVVTEDTAECDFNVPETDRRPSRIFSARHVTTNRSAESGSNRSMTIFIGNNFSFFVFLQTSDVEQFCK